MMPDKAGFYAFCSFLLLPETPKIKEYKTEASLKSPNAFIPWHAKAIGSY
jgi:hypothetical protein